MTEEDKQVIVAIMQEHTMVKGFTNLRTRRSGSMNLIDVHLILDKDLPLKQVHNICDEIEQKIKDQFTFCEILIHVEPSGNLMVYNLYVMQC